jgi:hypothetical protein
MLDAMLKVNIACFLGLLSVASLGGCYKKDDPNQASVKLAQPGAATDDDLGKAIGTVIGNGIVTGFDAAGKAIQKHLQDDQVEFNQRVTNPANWKIVTDGERFTARINLPSKGGWVEYMLFPVCSSKEETQGHIDFYINFWREQFSHTNAWKDLP